MLHSWLSPHEAKGWSLKPPCQNNKHPALHSYTRCSQFINGLLLFPHHQHFPTRSSKMGLGLGSLRGFWLPNWERNCWGSLVCDCHLVGHWCVDVGDRGEFCSHFSSVVRGAVASSPVKEIFCCTVPVLMGILVIAEPTDHHQVVWWLLKAAFAIALLNNHKD